MPGTSLWDFPPFRLDPVSSSLWREEQLMPLSPKPLAVLIHLVSHAGEVVTKEDLLDTVWPDTAVTEGVLKGCVRQLRQVLGDTAASPRYIATVHRRGYRFIAPVSSPDALPAVSKDSPSSRCPAEQTARALPPYPYVMNLMVGRETELAQLQQRWEQVQKGERQIVFISGEAGIGKTTLVDAFVAQLSAANRGRVSRGQCIEHYGAGEAYLPLLEALGHLSRGPTRSELIAALRQQAPSWLLQLPALADREEIDALQHRVHGTTRERMLRELAEAMEALTAEQELVIVLEDLHWCDSSTMDWLTYVARRRTPARLLVLGTYRSTEAIVHRHPVHKLVKDLELRSQGSELVMTYLPKPTVALYLARRFGNRLRANGLVCGLLRRTSGSPLFLVAIVDEWVRQGILREEEAGWRLSGDVEKALEVIPESLRQLIDQQLLELQSNDRQTLEAASVAGIEFAAAAVSAITGDNVEVTEEGCETLARQNRFLRPHGVIAWPDGTVSACYRFVHDLYRETLYQRISINRQMRWHKLLGQRLEAVFGERAPDIAAELAVHFAKGRDAAQAVVYAQYAGENALRRSAHGEAVDHFATGLEMLASLPDTPKRARQELTLLLAMGPALGFTRGYATPEVEQTYLRAQAICEQLEESSQSLLVLHGLWSLYNGRLWYWQARELGEQYLAQARRQGDPVAIVQAHYALGASLYYLGEFPLARWHFEQGIACYELERECLRVDRAGLDPGVACLAFLASTLGFLGYPDQAKQRDDDALRFAQELDRPYSLAFAHYRAGLNALFCRQSDTALAFAETVLDMAATHGFPFYNALGTALKGGALVRQGHREAGLHLLRQGLMALYEIGTKPAPHWLIWQADFYGHAEQFAAGLGLLEEAMAQANVTGNLHAVAELHRLKGEFLKASSAAAPGDIESCFYQALAVSRHQQAKMLELRAAISLSRFRQSQGQPRPARYLLARVYDAFTEGFDTADLKEAKALLEELTASG